MTGLTIYVNLFQTHYTSLRRPEAGLRPGALPGLRPRVPVGLLVQAALFLHLLPHQAAFAECLHKTVLWPVAHRQIVLTIPKILRAYFRYDRRLLGDLCRVAAEAITRSFRVLLGNPLVEPGLVPHSAHLESDISELSLARARAQGAA